MQVMHPNQGHVTTTCTPVHVRLSLQDRQSVPLSAHLRSQGLSMASVWRWNGSLTHTHSPDPPTYKIVTYCTYAHVHACFEAIGPL